MSEKVEQPVATDAVEIPDPGTCVAVVCPDSAADASYFAAGLAHRLAQRPPEDRKVCGVGAVLVDGLPGAGGLDVVLDVDHAPGARWAALRGASGALETDRLLRALPLRDNVAVLSHDRACDAVESSVRARTIAALADLAPWVVGTVSPERVPDPAFTSIILLTRGSVTGVAGARRYVEQVVGGLPVGVVSLETPSAVRMLVADSLGGALLTSAPTRWKLPHAAGDEVSQGLWPGSKDRVFRRLLDDVAVYLRSQGRSALWV